MTRRPARIAIVAIAILITVGVGYLAWLDEQELASRQDQAALLDRTAGQALVDLANLRAVLHAYVAPGQAGPVWTARATPLIDGLRQALLSLDAAVATAGGSLATAIDGVDRIAAGEKRAREYLEEGRPLVAGDVIFVELQDVVDTASQQLAAAREALRGFSDRGALPLRREQAGLVATVLATWMLVAIILIGPAARSRTAPQETHEISAAGLDLALMPFEPEAPGPETPERDPRPVAPAALQAIAEVCSELSSLSDERALSGALAKACELLDATGAVVWVVASDGQSLAPGLAHGFDQRVLKRIGAVPINSGNLTAAAYRDGAARVVAAEGSTPAAFAVPMIGPSGPVGVVSAEIRGDRCDVSVIAMATIFAAQLASLVLPASGSAPGAEDARRQAQA